MQRFPDPRGRSPERLYSPAEIVRSGLCIGCGSCAAAHPAASMGWDRHGFLKPAGPTEWYEAASEQLAQRCPFVPGALDEDRIAGERFPKAPAQDSLIGRFEAAYVGHVAEEDFRRRGSSGGLTNWVAAELLRTGAVDGVAHVVPTDPHDAGKFFDYQIARSAEELQGGAKSRYYPVDLSSALLEIRATPGRYAIVAVPCFIKAIHLLRRADPLISDRVTHTLGLFCGHQKSAAMVESFAWQLKRELGEVRALDYRIKDESRPANWYRAHLDLEDGASAEQDWWHLADGDWGAGYFQNPACNWCDDVVAETADIAFGDAWLEPYSSDGRGTNAVIVRTKEMRDLIEKARADGRLQLESVGADFVIQTQAAGLRHRREGLAYRLTWRRRGIIPIKRVSASRRLPVRRKLVYRLRYSIARWSSPFFRVARALHVRGLYLAWARSILRLYQAVAWSRGPLGRLFDALSPR